MFGGPSDAIYATIREFITYLYAVHHIDLPEKVEGDSPITEAVNALIDVLIRQAEMVLPQEPMQPPWGPEPGGGGGAVNREELERLLEEKLPQMMAARQPILEPIEYVLFDEAFWTAKDIKVGRIVSNEGGGLYIIAEQMRNPDLSPAAWIDAAYTVSGNGDPSPNGDFKAAGTYVGYTYYEPAGAAFALWSMGGRWTISTGAGAGQPHFWWRGFGEAIEGSYDPGPASDYTGNPVVALTTLTARDIEENPNGVVDSYVIFWQERDTNNEMQTVCFIVGGTAATPAVLLPADFETEAAQTDSWDRTNPAEGKDGVSVRKQTRTAYDHTSNEILYAYYRTFVYDDKGNLLTISAETRVTVDAPETC